MQVEFPGFVGAAYQSRSWKASAQRAINFYLEQDPEKQLVLYVTPGTRLAAEYGTQATLALLETPSNLIVATTSEVRRYSGVTGGNLSGLGPVGAISASPFVSLCQAGNYVMLTNGTNGYQFDRTDPLAVPALIASAGFPANPQYCTALNGRFIVNQANSGVFNWSQPFDPSTWDPLEFAEAEMLNDALVRPIVLERELYLVGQTSTEIWAASLVQDEVFAPIQGTYIPYGTVAPETCARIGKSLLWLSRDENGEGIVVRARGLNVARVSTHAIEQEIATFSTIADAYGWCYQQLGHEFYVLSFPTAKRTFVFDLTIAERLGPEMAWMERASTVAVPNTGNPPTKVQQHHVGRCHAYFRGLNVIGSRVDNGALYALDPEVYTEAIGVDFEIVCTRASPHVFANGQFVTVNRVEFGMQPGVGLPTGAAEDMDPVALVRVSKDGGQTWGPQRSVGLGAVGKYRTRIGVNRLGRARDIVVELVCTARVFRAITSAQFETSL